MSNISAILRERAERHPDAVALSEVMNHTQRKTTFTNLEAWTNSLSAKLVEGGLVPGDVVLVLYPISAELYAIVLAVLRIGCTVMLLDPSAGISHVNRCCKVRPPVGLIGSPKAHLLRLACRALRAIPKKFVINGWAPAASRISTNKNAHAPVSIYPCTDDHPALITFTSGGTGIPKAALRTHGFLMAQNRVLARTLELKEGETDLATLPVFILANIAAGVTTVIPDCDLRFPGRIDTDKVLAQIDNEQPQSTACSPAFIGRIAEAALKGSQKPLRSFQRIYTGGAPVTPRLMQTIAEAAPAANVVAVYGSTEAEPIAEISLGEIGPTDLAATDAGGGLPAGVPVEEIQLRIIKDSWSQPLGKLSGQEFDAMTLGVDERGEIVVTGDHVLKSYLDGRGNEETKFDVDGQRWHRTGDAGYLDIQGRLWLLGRCQSVIRDSRGVLYPFAVEMVAQSFDGIARAALVSVDKRRILIVEPKPGEDVPSEEQLHDRLPWAHLDEIRLMKSIPVDRRHNAKIDYSRLLAKIR